MIERHELGGTDGVRGQFIHDGPLGEMTPETVALLSASLTDILLDRSGGRVPQIVIGGDTRKFNNILTHAAVTGVRSRGGVPMVVGTAPTPALQKLSGILEADGTIALTASHNPAGDAGWKGMFGADKPYGDEVKAIDDVFWGLAEDGFAERLNLGAEQTYEDHRHRVGDYISLVAEDIQRHFGERPLEGKIVAADTARGAAGKVTPAILELLGATVEQFACDTDGAINDGCGATHLEGLENFLRERPELTHNPRFIGAVANDGDADRVMGLGVDFIGGEAQFHTLDGNTALELMAIGQLGVVGTVYTNDAAVERIRKAGSGFKFCPNGDVHVTRSLKLNGWQRGAEFSGHEVDLSWLGSGDGGRMAAWLLAYAAVNDTNFAEIRRQNPLYPELMRSIRLTDGTTFKSEWIEEVLELSDTDIANHFRHVTRASGTEPLVRIWGVGREEKYVQNRVGNIVNAIQRSLKMP